MLLKEAHCQYTNTLHLLMMPIFIPQIKAFPEGQKKIAEKELFFLWYGKRGTERSVQKKIRVIGELGNEKKKKTSMVRKKCSIKVVGKICLEWAIKAMVERKKWRLNPLSRTFTASSYFILFSLTPIRRLVFSCQQFPTCMHTLWTFTSIPQISFYPITRIYLTSREHDETSKGTRHNFFSFPKFLPQKKTLSWEEKKLSHKFNMSRDTFSWLVVWTWDI